MLQLQDEGGKKSRNMSTMQNVVPHFFPAHTKASATLWKSNELENRCRLAALTHQLHPQIFHRRVLPFKETERKPLNLQANKSRPLKNASVSSGFLQRLWKMTCYFSHSCVRPQVSVTAAHQGSRCGESAGCSRLSG